tara:strand:+ start:158 stop:1063 length:906 start_codon:yes stop_codon:yes gene_type:complete
MRLGNLLWNILNFLLLLGVIVVLAWPIVGPVVEKNKFKPNRNSFFEHYFEDDKYSNFQKKQYSSKHPLGTDSNGRDKMLVISSATLRNIQYALVAVIPFLVFGILSGLMLSFGRGKTSIGHKIELLNPMKLGYYALDWSIKILHSFPVVIVILVGVLFVETTIPPKLRIYGLMFIFGSFCVPQLAYDIEKEVNVLRKKEFIKAAEALGVSKFRLIIVDVLWYSCRDIIFSRSMNLFLAAIAIEIFKTFYMSSSSATSLGTLFNQNYWFDYKSQALVFLGMVFFSVRWFTERLIYDDGVTYG